MRADLVLFNGRVHTLDAWRPFASAVAVRDEHIAYMGDDATAREMLRPGGEVIDLQGRCVIPGLTDAHLHFQWYAIGLQAADAETPTLDEALARVREKAQVTPPGAWILGTGWNHNVWHLPAPDGFPTAADLDRVAPEHPVALRAKSGHALWVNSRAMQLAGITSATPDPFGGHIVRDGPSPRSQPTGILLEDAMDVIDHVRPTPTLEHLVELMRAAFPLAHRAGLTGIHCFDGPEAFAAYQLLHQRSELGLRVVKSIRREKLSHAIELGLRSGFGDDWLRVGSVKLFADGALGPQTAWMLEPFEGSTSLGIATLGEEEMAFDVRRANAAGLSCAIHAIGDRACRTVLDVYEEVGERALRNRIEHVQLLHPQDYDRLGRLGVIASMQPIHATSDMLISERYWGQRSAGAYAWRTQLNARAALAFGSDCPVEKIDPLPGIHAAVTRRRADGSPGPDGWYPEQRLTVEEAVRGFTGGAAYAAGLEDRLGSITPGKLADFTVLDQDIFEIEPMEILNTRVDATVIGGKFMWRANGLS
jgi:predicted amidohydrolase YtcJ